MSKTNRTNNSNETSPFSMRLLLCILMLLVILATAVAYYVFGSKEESLPPETILSTSSPLFTDNPPLSSPPDSDAAAFTPSPLAESLSRDQLEQLILSAFSRYLGPSEIIALSSSDLSLLYYGLYAVSGLQVSSSVEGSADFFPLLDWYVPNETDPKIVKQRFNDFQLQNTALIERMTELSAS